MSEIKSDLSLYWNLLKDVEKIIHEKKVELSKANKTLNYLKGEIRKLNQWADKYKPAPEDNWRCRYPDDGYGDTRYVKYKLPYILSPEEKEEFIKEQWCHWYNPWNDGRDCTGVWFTSYIKLIDAGNETIVIHVQNCDV